MSEALGMAVAGLITVMVNYTTLFLIFPSRYGKRLSIFLSVLFVAAYYSILIMSGIVTSTYGGFRGLFHLPFIIFIFRGQFFQKIFALLLTMQLSTLQIQPAKMIAGFLADSDYYVYLIFILLVIYSVYMILMFKFGRRFFNKLFITGRKPEWGIYSLGALFSRGNNAAIIN